jgi:hypothetical protein
LWPSCSGSVARVTVRNSSGTRRGWRARWPRGTTTRGSSIGGEEDGAHCREEEGMWEPGSRALIARDWLWLSVLLY